MYKVNECDFVVRLFKGFPDKGHILRKKSRKTSKRQNLTDFFKGPIYTFIR